MSAEKSICVICAWRENCKKKFSLSGHDTNCPDYTRDLTIRDESESKEKEESSEPSR